MNEPEPFATLPPAVRERARPVVGEPVEVERLGGMSGGRVYRIRGQRRSVIAKRPARAAEAVFYRDIVPAWEPAQRFTPELIDTVRDARRWWLLLEEIPRPLPRERLVGDAELLAALARLHAAELPEIPADAAPYRPAWTEEMTKRALAMLPDALAAATATPLADLQQMAQPLFSPRVPLSGDPNPTNWGLRDDGRVVLFDWERFCRGTPALDLAITIPGLGDAAAFRQVARRYLGEDAPRPSHDPDEIARQIAIAKVWSVVEFLGVGSGLSARAAANVAWVADRVTPWLLELCREMDLC